MKRVTVLASCSRKANGMAMAFPLFSGGRVPSSPPVADHVPFCLASDGLLSPLSVLPGHQVRRYLFSPPGTGSQQSLSSLFVALLPLAVPCTSMT